MMAVSKKYTRDQLSEFYRVVKPGDILEFPRAVYSHFGVYVGKYKGINHCVVHFAVLSNPDNYHLFKISSSLKESNLHENPDVMKIAYLVDKAMAEGINHGEIRIDSVQNILDPRLGIEVRINNKKDKKWDPQNQVAERAISTYENRHNEPPYNLRTNNCEHFVNNQRYGQHVSDQVNAVETAATVGKIVVGAAALIGAACYLFGHLDDNREKEKKRRY